MKYYGLTRGVLVIFATLFATVSTSEAKAEFSNNLISDLDLDNSQKLDAVSIVGKTPKTFNISSRTKLQPNNESKTKSVPCLSAEGSVAVKSPEPILVRNIRVAGSTIFTKKDIEQLVQKLDQQNLTPEQFPTKLQEAIAQFYLDNGYINSTTLSPVVSDDKVLEIQVIEGRIAEINVQGIRGVNPSYICSRIKLGVATPLNTNDLEDQLKLLRTDPLFSNVEASLIASGNPGESNLNVLVIEARRFSSSFSFDNYSPASVGSQRVGVDLQYRNLLGIGDEIAASYYRTLTGGADVFSFSYELPLNPMNGTLTFRVAPDRNKITQSPFDQFGIRGNQQLYEINYRQPLVRTPREEFALSLGFAYQSGQSFIFDQFPNPFGIGPDENGASRTSVIKFSQDYMKRDSGGAWLFKSQFSFGLGILDATINNDPIPDSRFISWLGQVQRVQRLNDDNLLIVLADLQLSPDSLLASQQFIIGGGQSLRGYRQNARFGDNGFRFTVENRISLQRDASGEPTLQVAPFIDLGAVWNKPDNPNKLSNQTFLASSGLGILWNRPFGVDNLSLRFDYGFPFINLNDRGNNLQDNGLYFSARYKL
ncbi:MAG: ShlB/FhaC/HecB family hemolysin secretion/activation protein [Scytonematopsis contorta HA4267-MV1]|jgi:hemolysin activation/secretion protein|nr:ShlB/FhaC/HecB family hemolysin secretion/activation protein [Scytonematopsis contorta HA4267-MV1]